MFYCFTIEALFIHRNLPLLPLTNLHAVLALETWVASVAAFKSLIDLRRFLKSVLE